MIDPLRDPRSWPVRSLAVLGLVAAACSPLPSTPSPSVTTSTPSASGVRVALETRFAGLAPGRPYPGSVWSMDEPVRLSPRAFGAFPSDVQPGPFLTVDRVRLATSLPTEPSELDVALVGRYDDSWRTRVAQTVEDPAAWDAVPQLASLSSHMSLGPMPLLSSGLDAARSLLARNGLLAPDMELHPHPPAGRFEYIRHLGGVPIFTNLGVALVGLRDGGTQALGRRRPILGLSRYPIRSPMEAWNLLVAGRGQTMYVDDGAPLDAVQLPEFVATSVELVYLELQVQGPRELMQPYYAFRQSDGRALYIPAVAF